MSEQENVSKIETGLKNKEYVETTETKLGSDGVEEIHVSYEQKPKSRGQATEKYVVDPETGVGSWVKSDSYTVSKKQGKTS